MESIPGRASGGLLPWNDSAMFWTTFGDADETSASSALVAAVLNMTDCSAGGPGGGNETPQLGLYHAANALILLAFCVPTTLPYGQALLHAGLAAGYLTLSTWAWNALCANDIFAWYFGFMTLNTCQLFYIFYRFRPIHFQEELEELFQHSFKPLGVTKLQFQKFVSPEHASVVDLHSGECYAVENMTKTDRLGIVLSGRCNVLNDKNFLHSVGPHEFLDSPEFESSSSEDVFRVSICAACPSKYVVWERATLEYLFVKEPYLAYIFGALISEDITEKLFNMDEKLKKPDGAVLDIRLPGIASHLNVMTSKEHKAYRSHMGD